MRHFNEGPKADKWYEENEEGTAGWDLCRHCGHLATGQSAAELGLSEGPNGDPLDTVSEGESQVDYNEDGFDYECELCGCTLGYSDN